jgi:hypothetical protein
VTGTYNTATSVILGSIILGYMGMMPMHAAGVMCGVYQRYVHYMVLWDHLAYQKLNVGVNYMLKNQMSALCRFTLGTLPNS